MNAINISWLYIHRREYDSAYFEMEIFYLLNISQLSQTAFRSRAWDGLQRWPGPRGLSHYPCQSTHYTSCYQGGDTRYMETAVIHWTVNNRVLQSSPRMQLTTAVLPAELQGRLVIDKTLALDSGNYSCLPSYATPDWVMVHIVTGQNTGGRHEEYKCNNSVAVRVWVMFCNLSPCQLRKVCM